MKENLRIHLGDLDSGVQAQVGEKRELEGEKAREIKQGNLVIQQGRTRQKFVLGSQGVGHASRAIQICLRTESEQSDEVYSNRPHRQRAARHAGKRCRPGSLQSSLLLCGPAEEMFV